MSRKDLLTLVRAKNRMSWMVAPKISGIDQGRQLAKPRGKRHKQELRWKKDLNLTFRMSGPLAQHGLSAQYPSDPCNPRSR